MRDPIWQRRTERLDLAETRRMLERLVEFIDAGELDCDHDRTHLEFNAPDSAALLSAVKSALEHLPAAAPPGAPACCSAQPHCAFGPTPTFDVATAMRRLRAEYDDVVEVPPDDRRGRLSHTGRAFASMRGDRGDHRVEEWVRIDHALALGLRDEGDLRRLLAMLGWSENCEAWYRVVVGEGDDVAADV